MIQCQIVVNALKEQHSVVGEKGWGLFKIMVNRKASLRRWYLRRSLHKTAVPPNSWGHHSYCTVESGHGGMPFMLIAT